ncbi:hypothetical protein I3760_12G056900 [Carya illinoinensis]|uniref:RING-type domain-containing protein n=1 Tax=Carya illinoinensis TaxID=32201 RepID=A0A8T1NVB7_CARIL|nr:E3 ubiquitin-protein ligase BOI-like [Carya illinoinensis]KAG2676527.1 hypothetical protein I3760_12G056900 [Carya illinoinensis]KAG6633591.1 hypothetical protein CIPAW_12G058700 [Carya illinoinensis]
MAVQAQYPSNVLLLNRNGKEGHDYSLQTQPGGLLDQSHMLLINNGVGANNNPRKRAREVAQSTGVSSSPHINPMFSLQSQPSQLIDVSQLHNNNIQQPNVVSTGLRLSFGEQRQQQHQRQQLQQQQQNVCHSSSPFSSLIAEDVAAQIKQQIDEIEQFLQAQGEQLRRTLAEKRQRHYRALLAAAEGSVARRLREKETEVEKATRRNAELEARAAQLSVEAQVWQAKAHAQEVTAATLQAQLQKAIVSGGGGGASPAGDSRKMEDTLGCAVGGVEGNYVEDAGSAYIDPDRVVVSGPRCKACRKRVASVVLLPCRHMCICTECDQVAQACPLCLTMRSSSIEVYLS